MEIKTENSNGILKSFIICKRGHTFIPIKTKELYLFASSLGTSFVIDASGNKYVIDKSLAELENMVDRRFFFRVNRQIIVNIHAIKEFKSIEFGKILIQLKNADWVKRDIIVSQVNAPLFRDWIYSL